MAKSPEAITISRRAVRRAGLTVLWVVIVAVIAGLLITVIRDHTGGTSDAVASNIDSSTYQGVFLTSGEVYFGKLSYSGGDFYILKRVFRLTTQPAKKSGSPPQRTLVRITLDVHSPQDEMIINRRALLYVENLNPSGRAAKFMGSGTP